jgi:hypothetical protein
MLPASEDKRFSELGEQGFTFACNPQVPCFNQCCRRLNLVLTPYDVLRLRTNLGISSDEFLDEYTDVEPGQNGWPQVKLKMNQDKERLCPFVSLKKGCTVYQDRPGACRTYPLGRATRKQADNALEESFFLVREDHCQGFLKGAQWTPDTWTKDQGLEIFNQVNDLFLPLITRQPLDADSEVIAKKMHMFFLACYRLEAFRSLATQGKMSTLFDIPPERMQAIEEDDLELLKFSFDWLKFSLFGDPTMRLKKT